MFSLPVIALAMIVAIFPAPSLAQTAPEPIPVEGTPTLMSGGPRSQTDPHISGSLVAYTNETVTSAEVRYHDLNTGTDMAIPNDGHRDTHAAISGSTIVFRRIYTDGITTAHPIMLFDTANSDAGIKELDPTEGALRSAPSIAGDTVAWTEQAGPSSNMTDIVVYDIDTGVATQLTTDGTSMTNGRAEVSVDGALVTWSKCPYMTSSSCEVYTAARNLDGSWSSPVQLTHNGAHNTLPVSNGQVVAFSSNAGGDYDLWWMNADGSFLQQLTLPGTQYPTAISGGVVAFVSYSAETSPDLYVYDLTSGTLYQVTNTPDMSEAVIDLAVGPDGMARMVWAQPDGLESGDMDVYVLTSELEGDRYVVCPLFDQTRSYKIRSTVPIRLQLCDEEDGNLSSPELAVTATGLVKQDSTSSPVVVEDSGNANPDNNFRYDESLQGYAYNLSTKNLSAGTWQLHFTVSGDPTVYGVTFDLR